MKIKEKEFEHALIDKGLNKKGLAKELGKTPSYITKILSKGTSYKNAKEIAEVLNVKMTKIAEYEVIRK